MGGDLTSSQLLRQARSKGKGGWSQRLWGASALLQGSSVGGEGGSYLFLMNVEPTGSHCFLEKQRHVA